MSELENTTQEPPFKNLYLVRLGLGLCSAFVILIALLMTGSPGSAFIVLTMLGGAMLVIFWAIDPWPLSAKLFSNESIPRGPHASLAKRLELFAYLLIMAGAVWRIFA